LRVDRERSGKREGCEGKGGTELAMGSEEKEKKNKWGRGEGKPVVKSRRLWNTLGKLVSAHRIVSVSTTSRNTGYYRNSKCLLDILEISWNLIAPPGNFLY